MATAEDSDTRSIPADLAMGWSMGSLGRQNHHDDQSNNLVLSHNNVLPTQSNIINFYMRRSDDPWTPSGLVAAKTSTGIPPHARDISGHQRPYQSAYNFHDYRSTGQPSECDTLPGDSGYGGSGPTCSIESASTIHEDDGAFDSQIASQLMGSFHLGAESQSSQADNFKHYCTHCQQRLRTQSELNKHIQRHQKPHRCSYSNCPRAKEGFSTTNDLQRHKRTVHNEHEAWYICHHGTCKDKTAKKWPRADNFRSHLLRVHQQKVTIDAELACYLHSPNPPQHSAEAGDLATTFAQDVSRANNFQVPLNTPSEQRIVQTLQSLSATGQVPSTAPRRAGGNTSALQSSMSRQRGGLAASFRNDQVQYIQPDILHESNEAPDIQLQGHVARSYMAHPGQGSNVSDMHMVRIGEGQDSPADNDTEASSDIPYEEVDTAATPTDHMDDNALGLYSPDHESKDLLLAGVLPGFGTDPDQLLKSLQSLPRELLETALSAKDNAGLGAKISQQCHKCRKSFKRPCELKKHMKRHDKPYGCTFRDCTKVFGSKNDWKRHESSQHCQLETWNCNEGGCTKVCHRRESLKTHLSKDHSMTDRGLIQERLENCRVGRHCMTKFWCGFCRDQIEVQRSGANWWAKRCDHIDGHLFGKDGLAHMSIKDWKYEDMDVTQDTNSSGDAERQFSDTSSSASDTTPSASLKRNYVGKHDEQPAKKVSYYGKNYMWQCCVCSQLVNLKTSTSCFQCGHVKCDFDKVECTMHEEQV